MERINSQIYVFTQVSIIKGIKRIDLLIINKKTLMFQDLIKSVESLNKIQKCHIKI